MAKGWNQPVINLSGLPPTTLVGQIARWPLKALPRNLTVRILQGQLKGKKWIVGSTRHACWLGSYEVHIQNVIAQELERGGVFFDVGANVGFYSLLACTLIQPGKVFAFEPLPANVCFIKKHLQLNKIENVEVLEVGVSNQQGIASFQDEETRGMGRLQPGGNLSVRTVTLDQLLQEERIAPPNWIKMDIEGEESRALMGARECFQNHKPTLILATHGREVHAACCQLLHSWGYDYRLLQGGPQEDRAELIAKPSRRELSARWLQK